MISSNQISEYVNSLLELKKEETDDLHSFLTSNNYPVIQKDISRFISQIVMIKQPQKILEIGTNEGYSSIVMALKMKKGTITTIDYREDLHDKARLNFEKFKVADKINLVTKRAQAALSEIDDKFDMIFIDAEKKAYDLYLSYAISHINPGGIILVDNLFWKGSVISPESFENEKTAVPTLTEFNKRFTSLKGFNSQVLSIGDGLGFAVKEDHI